MGGYGGRTLVAVGLAVVAVSVGALVGHRSPRSPAAAISTHETGAEEVSPSETVKVHVSGMVMSPGVVDVPVGAIVADAIEAAGGLRAEAAADQINLAAPVRPGEQIVVPGPGLPNAPMTEEGPLRLSLATASDLETLPGVGPVLAERIIEFRDENGGFAAVEDLLQVPGIGEAKLAAMRELVEP